MLIPEDDFVEYCEDLVCEIFEPKIPSVIVVDWDATADNLRVDYCEVELDGATFLVRYM